ncbi:unnamed protein product, partial [Closterium sp. NIES-54]
MRDECSTEQNRASLPPPLCDHRRGVASESQPFLHRSPPLCPPFSPTRSAVRERRDSFDWTARMVLAEQVGEALVFIHSKGYIHRDFKAANVLLAEGSGVLICLGVLVSIHSKGYIHRDFKAANVLLAEVGGGHPSVLGSIHPQPLPSCHFIPAPLLPSFPAPGHGAKGGGLWNGAAGRALEDNLSALPAHASLRSVLASPCCCCCPPFPRGPYQGMVPKVADFGMARLVEDWKTHVTTRVGGSQGYIDPNYFSTGFLTNHCDTYAFGIFLLELMSGECAEENGFKAIRVAAEERLIPLEKLKRVVMDKTIAGQWSEEHVRLVLKIFRLAVCTDWANRPKMDQLPLGGDGAPPMYTKAELSAATDNFKHKLGEGGFGAVYKGFLKVESGAEAAESLGVDLSAVSDGEIPVAVKMCAAKPLGGDGAPPMYTKAELSAATDNFKHKLGEGGFGAVYKGFLKVESGAEAAESLGVDLSAVSDGEIPVAVKMCAAKVLSAREQLMTEMMVMGKLRHPNILRLLGACISDDSMAMIYEFIPCGDVHELLEDARAGKEEFKFEDRMKVAMGCAEALSFIHGQEYVHRDFKAPNVLLAEGLSPRVADFGLARIVENWKDHVTTRVMGSRGYIDPEYFESGVVEGARGAEHVGAGALIVWFSGVSTRAPSSPTPISLR